MDLPCCDWQHNQSDTSDSQPEANELDESGYSFYSVPETGAGLFLASGLDPWVGMRGESPIA